MKKINIFILAFLPFSLSALDLETSVTYQPFVFTGTVSLFENEYIDLSYDMGQQIIYQAGLNFRSGLNFGFGFKYDSGYDINDNLVGKMADLMGYLGFKYFRVKVSHLTIPGSASVKEKKWQTELAVGQPRTRKFESKRTSVSLLFDLPGLLDKKNKDTFYLGLYYTHSVYPDFISTDNINEWTSGYRYNLNSRFYHAEITEQIYGISFGWDTLPFCLNNEINKEFAFAAGKGWALYPWGEGSLSLGFGESVKKVLYIDQEKEERGIAIDLLHAELTLGTMFIVGEKTKAAIGVGYMAMGLLNKANFFHGLSIRGGIKI